MDGWGYLTNPPDRTDGLLMRKYAEALREERENERTLLAQAIVRVFTKGK